jgi:type II secretory pathway pseudopilin PulG
VHDAVARRFAISSVRGSAAQRGITIIDSLIGLVLVIVATAGLLGVIPYSFVQIEYDSISVQANAVGQQFLDSIRYDVVNGVPVPTSTTAPIDFGKSYSGGGADTVAGNFSLTNQCTALNGSTLTEDCSVTVQWNENRAARQLTLETYITNQL